MKVKSESEVARSCLTPSDPMDCSPPGSPVPGILQARTLEWGAIAFSGDVHIHTAIYKDLLYSTWNSARCYVAAWMGREFGEEWIHVYVWLNPPFAVLLKLSQHGLLIGYTSIQNQKFKKKRAMFLVSALELNEEKKEESIQRN